MGTNYHGKTVPGGICAPKGFLASGVHCGIRKNRTKRDLALIVSECGATAAAVYTKNLVQGAPISVTKENLADGRARAVICNSGNANTCNANGVALAKETCALLAQALGISPMDVIVASTGVIGQEMDIAPFRAGIPALVAGLGDHSDEAADAIMTTDLKRKEIAVEFRLGGVPCRLGGIAKGSGMIHPNMATMLVFLTTDAAVSPALLHKALLEDVKDSFNMVSVDGDTSTNDMVSIMANGMAGNPVVDDEGPDYEAFRAALAQVTTYLCRALAADGEGATKLLECRVTGAADEKTAKAAAKSVICSSLVKTAMFGADANWGRELCALGYCGEALEVDKIGVAFRSAAGEIPVCRNGVGVPFSEELAKKILSEREIEILVELGMGDAAATAWGCDLTYDYVKINGDYRT
jgi:glutamate N-acetyltransferase/amino-acid N-acetyltransferase